METKNKSVTNKLLENVVNGNYPAQCVNKMDNTRLEKFVLCLVEFTSLKMGAKIQSSTSNWQSLVKDTLVDKKRKKNGNKEFRQNLKKVVLHCSEYFQNFNSKWLPLSRIWRNDENFDVIHARKRKKDCPFEICPAKKRKTILSFENNLPIGPYIYLSRCAPESPELTNPLTQTEFLTIFKLGTNNHETSRPLASTRYRTSRLLNCPHIPFSSDIGRIMIRKENIRIPSCVNERKLDRLEWYLNKRSTVLSDVKYPLTYVPCKNYTEHIYNFPVKRYGQIRKDAQYKSFLQSFCKPCSVLLKKENLCNLKSNSDNYQVKIPLQRLSDKQINELTRTKPEAKEPNSQANVISNNETIGQPKILANIKIKPKITKLRTSHKRSSTFR